MKRRELTVSQKTHLYLMMFLWVCLFSLVVGLIFFAIPRVNEVGSPQRSKPVLVDMKKSNNASRHRVSSAANPQYDFYTLLSRPVPPSRDTVKNVLTPNVEIGETQQHHYLLQVASLSNKTDAQRVVSQLMLLGYDSYIADHLSQQQHYYRVIVGPFSNLTLAEKERNRLQMKFSETFVVKS